MTTSNNGWRQNLELIDALVGSYGTSCYTQASLGQSYGGPSLKRKSELMDEIEKEIQEAERRGAIEALESLRFKYELDDFDIFWLPCDPIEEKLEELRRQLK